MAVHFTRWFLGLLVACAVLCAAKMGLAWASLSPATGCSAGSRWVEDLYERKAAIVRSLPPSVLVVGGSATHFGISAERLSEHGASVVNLGTHAGLGMPYLLERALRIARRGDTIVLALEYDQYRHDGAGDEALFEYAVCTGDGLDFVPRDELARRLLSLPPKQLLINFAFNDDRNRRYRIGTLNAHGDETSNTFAARRVSDLPIIRSRGRIEIPQAPSADARAVIESFLARAEAAGVHVAAAWPGLFAEAAPPGGDPVEGLAGFWREEGVPVVGCYSDSLLAPDEMYDTVYHANTAGSDRRSRALSPYLSALVAGDADAARCGSGAATRGDVARRTQAR